MLEFLCPSVRACISHVNSRLVYEIRMRADKPLVICLGGTFVFLGESGVCEERLAFCPTRKEIEDTLVAACGHSVYSVENQLRGGFVTAAYGERVGIAGDYVYEKGQVLSVRDITSLCIRVPHEIRGCGKEIYRRCCREFVRSVLILAPPGEGKTTILRDLSRIVSETTCLNVLVADERGELSAGETGATSDVMRFADKETAFTAGIRAMRPDVLVTDELLPKDYEAVKAAVRSGIAVFASAHLTRYEDVPEKLFERYVLLSGIGTIEWIKDREGNLVD